LPRVLAELSETLRSRGVLFCSNPRGNNEEGLSGDRYSCFFDHDTWRDYVTAAGFFQVRHYYRPPGLPRHKQWWLSTVWRTRVRSFTNRGQASRSALSDVGVWREWCPSGSGSSSFAEKREWQILRK
jgi:hypothetical protein